MLAATFTVSSDETRRFNLDCRPWLEQDEVITGADVEVTPVTEPLFYVPTTFKSVTPGEEPAYFNRLVFFTAGGKAGEVYNVEFIVATDQGQRRAACVRYIVTDGCGVSQ